MWPALVGLWWLVAASSPAVLPPCPEGYVCIEIKGRSNAEIVGQIDQHPEMGVVAFTIPQAGALAEKLLDCDKKADLPKRRGWFEPYYQFGWSKVSTGNDYVWGDVGLRVWKFSVAGGVGNYAGLTSTHISGALTIAF